MYRLFKMDSYSPSDQDNMPQRPEGDRAAALRPLSSDQTLQQVTLGTQQRTDREMAIPPPAIENQKSPDQAGEKRRGGDEANKAARQPDLMHPSRPSSIDALENEIRKIGICRKLVHQVFLNARC